MTGICKILGGYFGAQQAGDSESDGFHAIEVYPDGNPITHGHYATEEEAEAEADRIHAERLREHSQFGVGA
jgi:hypothetical protein